MSARNVGTSIDEFLQEEGILVEAEAQAVEEVAVWLRGFLGQPIESPRAKPKNKLDAHSAIKDSRPAGTRSKSS